MRLRWIPKRTLVWFLIYKFALCVSFNIWMSVALFVYTALTAVGFRDDYLKVVRKNRDGISSREKMIWQTLVTVVALAALLLHPASTEKIRQFYVPFHKEPVWIFGGMAGGLALFGFIFLWLVGFSNAINLTDGLDGLAIGCTITVAFAYGIMAYVASNSIYAQYLEVSFVPGAGELAVICGSLVGAGMAFLWYNSYPAEIFMGDVGSLALGGALGTVAILIKQELLLLMVGGVFVLEALSVIIQVSSFKMTGRRVFKMAPLHHHFELIGWSEPKVITRFVILAIIFALFSLTTLKLR